MMRSFAGLAAVLGLLTLAPNVADQHHGGHHGHGAMAAMEIKTSVADGATLSERPAQIEFTFSPAMRLTSAKLTTATGETIPVRFDATAPPSTTASVQFAPLTPDSYTLAYAADAGDHMMPGRIRFTVK